MAVAVASEAIDATTQRAARRRSPHPAAILEGNRKQSLWARRLAGKGTRKMLLSHCVLLFLGLGSTPHEPDTFPNTPELTESWVPQVESIEETPLELTEAVLRRARGYSESLEAPTGPAVVQGLGTRRMFRRRMFRVQA